MGDAQHNVGIRLNGDASGLVGATKQGAQSQKELEQQFKATEQQAKKNAAEAEHFAKGLRDQAAELGKTKRQVQEYRASQLTLTDAQRASVKTSLDQIDAHERQRREMRLLTRDALAVIAAVSAAAAATALMTKSAIDEADELNKLRQQIDISVEGLSVYRYQAGLAGVANQEFTLGMKQLAQSVAEARGGFGQGAAVFRVMGGETERLVKSGSSLEQVLPSIAEWFAGTADSAEKTAIAMALLGERMGSRLLPLLNMGRAGTQQMREELERMGGVVSGTTARQAEQFNDNIRKITVSVTVLGHALAKDLLPELVRITDQMAKGATEGGYFSAVIAAAKAAAAPGTDSAKFLANLAGAIPVIGPALSAILAARNNSPAARGGRAQTEFEESLAATPRFGLRRAPPLPRTGGDGADEFAKLLAQAREMNAVLDLEAAGADKATAAERTLLQIQEARAAGLLKLSGVQLAELFTTLDAASAKEREARARGEAAQRLEESRQAYQAHFAEQVKGLEQAAESNKRLREQNEEIGLTTEQLGMLTVARAAQALAIEREREAVVRLTSDNEAELRVARRRVRLAEEYVQLVAEGQEATQAAAARAKIDEENKRLSDDLNRAVTDGLMRGFERGESIAQNFRDNLVNAFKSAILRPTISAIIDPVTAPWAALIGQGSAAVQGWFSSPSPSYAGVDEAGFEGIDWSQFHAGGVVGRDGARRYVHPAYIERAPRMHAGGLMSDERPAILQVGEEVITRRDPRHRENLGGAPSSVRVTIDNRGAPIEATSATLDVDAEGFVVRVMTRQVETGGSFARTAQRTWGLNRAAGAVR